MSPEEAWLMVSMMKDVVQRGTAAGSRRQPVPLSRRRQDGHDERRHRRLVHRLHLRSRRRRLDGLRQAAEDQGQRAGRHSRRAGVDGVHERGLSPQAGAARLAAPRRHRRPPDRPATRPARRPGLRRVGHRLLHRRHRSGRTCIPPTYGRAGAQPGTSPVDTPDCRIRRSDASVARYVAAPPARRVYARRTP